MAGGIRKLALTTHLTVSIGWIGAVVAYLVLVAAAATSQQAQTVQAAWIAMELTGWYAIVPLALASLASGLVMALGTPWGLLRHYWVVFSLALTVLAVAVLLGHMPTVSSLADQAARTGGTDLNVAGELLHAGGGLVVLLLVAGLNVYKPPGLTRYGWRKCNEGLEN